MKYSFDKNNFKINECKSRKDHFLILNILFKMIGPTTELIAYGSICFVGVIGNLIVLLSISKVPHMQKTTKKIITNLTAIDLIINTIVIPCKIINILHPDLNDNPYSIAVIRCKIMPYIAELLFAALINTLVALTIDRYIAIVHPLTSITKRQYRVIMTVIWTLALVCSLPEMLVRHLNEMKCELTWPYKYLENLYYAFDATESCIAPACIVTYCYVVIWKIVKNRQIPGERIGNERVNERMEKHRIKTMKVIFVITMYFILSGLPLYIAFLAYHFTTNEQDEERNKSIHFWLDWLALTHLFMNPFLYCFMSTRIRKMFMNFMKCGMGDAERQNNSVTRTNISKTNTESIGQ